MDTAFELSKLRTNHGGLTPQTIWRNSRNAGAGFAPACKREPGLINGKEIYLRNGRSSFIAWERFGVRFDRVPVGKPRVHGEPAEIRSLFKRRPRYHEPVPAW